MVAPVAAEAARARRRWSSSTASCPTTGRARSTCTRRASRPRGRRRAERGDGMWTAGVDTAAPGCRPGWRAWSRCRSPRSRRRSALRGAPTAGARSCTACGRTSPARPSAARARGLARGRGRRRPRAAAARSRKHREGPARAADPSDRPIGSDPDDRRPAHQPRRPPPDGHLHRRRSAAASDWPALVRAACGVSTHAVELAAHDAAELPSLVALPARPAAAAVPPRERPHAGQGRAGAGRASASPRCCALPLARAHDRSPTRTWSRTPRPTARSAAALVFENMDDRKAGGRTADELGAAVRRAARGRLLPRRRARPHGGPDDGRRRRAAGPLPRPPARGAPVLDPRRLATRALTPEDEALFAPLLARCRDVPWILEAARPPRWRAPVRSPAAAARPSSARRAYVRRASRLRRGATAAPRRRRQGARRVRRVVPAPLAPRRSRARRVNCAPRTATRHGASRRAVRARARATPPRRLVRCGPVPCAPHHVADGAARRSIGAGRAHDRRPAAGRADRRGVRADRRRPRAHRRRPRRAPQAARRTSSLDPDATVVLLGSWGRHEVTSASDDDAIVLFCGARPRPTCGPSPARWRAGSAGRRPGRRGCSARPRGWPTSTDNIGLDGDTNTILTRRMLFLLESVPVAGDAAYAARARAAAGHLPRRPRARLPPAALPAQRPHALLAHDRRRLRGQAPRPGGGGVGAAPREAALQPQGAVRRRAAARARVPRAAGRRDAGVPRRAARRAAAGPPRRAPSSRTAWPTRAPARCAPTRRSSTLLDDPDARDAARRARGGRRRRRPRRSRASASSATTSRRALLALLFEDPELERLVREYLIF